MYAVCHLPAHKQILPFKNKPLNFFFCWINRSLPFKVNCKTFFVVIRSEWHLDIRVNALRENYSCNYEHQLKNCTKYNKCVRQTCHLIFPLSLKATTEYFFNSYFSFVYFTRAFLTLQERRFSQIGSVLLHSLFIGAHQWTNGWWLTDQSERMLYFCYVIICKGCW